MVQYIYADDWGSQTCRGAPYALRRGGTGSLSPPLGCQRAGIDGEGDGGGGTVLGVVGQGEVGGIVSC